MGHRNVTGVCQDCDWRNVLSARLEKKVFRVVCNVFARWVERCSCSDFLMFLENVFREDLKAVQFSEELFVCTSIWNQAFTV